MEYINHLAFILGPHMGKLPKYFAVEIIALPKENGVELKSNDRQFAR